MSGINQPINNIAKTTKLFINGEFPRTESGRSYPVTVKSSDQVFTHLCQSSRKDLRNAVVAAKAALSKWSGRTAYNRAQILYRMAEMLEGKRNEVSQILQQVLGMDETKANAEVTASCETFIYYAGFADKFSQVMASVNPVSGPFHNFTTPEPVGVVGAIYDKEFSLTEWVAQMASVIASGNTLVMVIDAPGAALTSEMGEIFKTSDLPAGVINILSGHVEELYTHMGQHMEVQSLLSSTTDEKRLGEFKEMAIENMKRVVPWTFENKDLSPIVAFTEAKTVWHPVGL